jgi:hypothetical protein
MTTLNALDKQVAPWYKHRWPWLLMSGPLVVIVAGFVTMWISFSGADALVVDDYYKQGKAINQDLRRDRMASNLRLLFSLRYDAASGNLVGGVKGLTNQLPLTLLLVHPTVPQKDKRMVVTPDSEGQFSLTLPMLERAHWQVQIEDAARSWRLQGDWSWPQQNKIDISPLQDKA